MRWIWALLSVSAAAENWPGFRGPRSDGSSTETGIPLRWEKPAWRTALPGVGNSSPVVWGKRVFATAFEQDRSVVQTLLSTGMHGELIVLCLDRDTGRLLWRWAVKPQQIEGTRNGNTPATPTLVTDGERVFGFFGSYGVVALDMAGNLLWEKKLGPFQHHMGTASSPVLADGKVLINCEWDDADFLLALDKRTGHELWRTPRRQKQAAYSTPVVWGDLVVVSGHARVKAYRLSDGVPLWDVGTTSDYVVPTPVIAAGLAVITSAGPGGDALFALRPDGTLAWTAGRASAYVASPVVAGGLVFTVKDNGVMSAMDAAGGRMAWQRRLPEPGRYYASPVTAEGRIYATNEHGATVVIRAADRFEVLAVGRLPAERVWASPAISAGRIFLRSVRELIAIGGN